MPRTYSTTSTSIWRDDDFRALTAAQQGTYFMLKSQAEITAAGVLPLTRGRWSKLSAGMDVATLNATLDVLAEHRFIVIDEDTEELLVRHFVKWDQGYQNSKRRPVIEAAALAISSPNLRHALAIQFTKLGLSDMASKLGGNTPSDTPPDTASDTTTPSDRVVVTEVSTTTTPNPYPQPATPGPVGSRSTKPAATLAAGSMARVIRAYVDACPEPPAEELQAKIERSARSLLAQGFDLDQLTTAAANAGRGGWIDLATQMQRDAARASPATNGARSTTDERFQAGLTLAATLAARENTQALEA